MLSGCGYYVVISLLFCATTGETFCSSVSVFRRETGSGVCKGCFILKVLYKDSKFTHFRLLNALQMGGIFAANIKPALLNECHTHNWTVRLVTVTVCLFFLLPKPLQRPKSALYWSEEDVPAVNTKPLTLLFLRHTSLLRLKINLNTSLIRTLFTSYQTWAPLQLSPEYDAQ